MTVHDEPTMSRAGVLTTPSGIDPIPLLEGMSTTRAIRRFTDDPVPDEALAAMAFAATRAPTGSNRQPFRLLFLRDGPEADRAKALLGSSFRGLWAEKRAADGYTDGSGVDPDSPKARMAATMDRFVERFEETPVVILACLRPWRQQDPTIGASVYPACQNLLLAARALGYGGVITMWHAMVENELRELLDIPDEVLIMATIAIGRPEGGHGPVRRRPVTDLVFDGRWDRSAPWATEPEGTRHTGGPPRRPDRGSVPGGS